ncbi:MAG: hypothetical protein LUG91_07780 [Ruminococcus sp.]|nr:hypothetical protein [Ruminococcus sp.]
MVTVKTFGELYDAMGRNEKAIRFRSDCENFVSEYNETMKGLIDNKSSRSILAGKPAVVVASIYATNADKIKGSIFSRTAEYIGAKLLKRDIDKYFPYLKQYYDQYTNIDKYGNKVKCNDPEDEWVYLGHK